MGTLGKGEQNLAMKNCENCTVEHDGSYGSGRFCSSKCSHGFGPRKMWEDKEMRQNIVSKLTGRTLSEEHHAKLAEHLVQLGKSESGKAKKSAYVKKYYEDNPVAKKKWRELMVSKYDREKLVAGIKKCVSEGKWLGWQTRKGVSSFPEVFFEKVLNNANLRYVREHKINRFFADFAFLEEKVVLEIDGKQHELPERQIHDQKRDVILENEGWKVYRIKWKNVSTPEGKDYMKSEIAKFLEFFRSQKESKSWR